MAGIPESLIQDKLRERGINNAEIVDTEIESNGDNEEVEDDE